MIERAKTILLFILVIGSVGLSVQLMYRAPHSDVIVTSRERPTEREPRRMSATEMLVPREIVIGREDGQQWLLYKGTSIFESVLKTWKEVSIRSVEERETPQVEGAWRKKGALHIFFIFHGERPVEFMREGIGFFSDVQQDSIMGKKLIGVMQKETMAVYVEQNDGAVIRIGDAEVTPALQREWEFFARQGVEVKPWRGTTVLPMDEITLREVIGEEQRWNSEQLSKKFLGLEATVRDGVAPDGSRVLTDGVRGVRVVDETQRLYYDNPVSVALVERGGSVVERWEKAVQFMNERGGWENQYTLQQVQNIQSSSLEESQMVATQEMATIEGVFVVSSKSDSIDHKEQIKLTLRGRTVTRVTRSIWVPQKAVEQTAFIPLLTGELLRKRLEQQTSGVEIRDVYVGYVPTQKEQHWIYTPMWVIELRSGKKIVIQEEM